MDQHASASAPINLSTIAAQQVHKRPLGSRMSKLRRAQQKLISKRRRVSNRNSRVRVSFSRSSTSQNLHSSLSHSLKHVSASPPQNGLTISLDPLANLETPRRRDARPLPQAKHRNSPVPKALKIETLRGSSPSHDHESSRYSLMQVPEEPGYLAPTPKQDEARVRNGPRDHVAMDSNMSRVANARRYGSYVVRAPPGDRRQEKIGAVKERDIRADGQAQCVPRPDIKDDNRRFAVLEPLVEDSISRSLSQQGRLSSISINAKTGDARILPSDSRQGRYLARFTKELEKYCMAATTGTRTPLSRITPTVSESPTTLETISDLLPYHKQFKASGLAVTSREQMSQPQNVGYIKASMGSQLVNGQVDGSTVTPSEQDADVEEVGIRVTPYSEKTPVPATRSGAQISRPAAKSFLPWLRQSDQRHIAAQTQRGRKFSKDHIHPSQAIPAEALLTPAHNAILDSYFDSPQSDQPQDEQPTSRNTSVSPLASASSPNPSTRTSIMDKPLPKQPPQGRCHAIPERNRRRHMENTAEWPTAGVVIHDSSSPLRLEEPRPVLNDRIVLDLDQDLDSPLSLRSNESTMRRQSVTAPQTREDALLVSRQQTNTGLGLVNEPGAALFTPPPKSKSASCAIIHRDSSRSVLSDKPLPVPHPAFDLIDSSGKEGRGFSHKDTSVDFIPDMAPQLPVVIPESSSSFKKALDAVISKLDAMEDRRQHEKGLEHRAMQPLSPESEVLGGPCVNVATSTSTKAPPSGRQASATMKGTKSGFSHGTAISDGDICDRDVLIGLKMAVCAACDETLDAWICEKTGLRLRRFLADLRAFESISRDKPSAAPMPLSRQIRRNEKGARKSRIKPASSKRPTKKWTPCFGGDGPGLIPESSHEA